MTPELKAQIEARVEATAENWTVSDTGEVLNDRRALLDYVKVLEASLDWAMRLELPAHPTDPSYLAATLEASRKRIAE
jgi:hypothetical protein